MTPADRARVLEAAKRGRISFYERDTHEETEFDCDTGDPVTIQIVHGVCLGCVANAQDNRGEERCARQDAWVHCATVAEVEAYLGPADEAKEEHERLRAREDRADTERDADK